MSLTGNVTCATTSGTAPVLFASAINFLAATQCFIPETSYQYTEDHESYDFIIVGGGSAGNVVASRLSEVRHWKILLLEAGPAAPIESDIPYMASTLYKSAYDWEYYTENDGVNHQAYKTNSVFWPRGKMLGGCSAINEMIYIRGRDNDFQRWVDAGNPSWTPENVNFYFRKAESFQDVELLKDSDIRDAYGLEGLQTINTVNSTYRDVADKVLESWDFMGFKRVKDINVAKFEGYGLSGIYRSTAANGRRYSTYTSYLEPIKDRENLSVVTNAFVTKILIKDNQTYGVEVDIFGESKTFYANIEVIISAGAINTPQLLMLSGIGPEEHLLSKNISCIANLPVGRNLHDHTSVPVAVYADEPGQENQAEKLFEIAKYMYNKTGLLAHNSFSDITTMFSRNQTMEYPEFQSHLLIAWQNSEIVENLFNSFDNETRDSFAELNEYKAIYVFIVHLLHPHSRGWISLNTTDPYDHPLIYANYYNDIRDLQASVDGIKMLTDIVNTPNFKSMNAFLHRVNISECNQYEFPSDLYWECYVRSISGTVYHPVGTAKMGPDPLDSVVDNFLKVHGVERLRVIDASVMPSITSGNTNAPTIMIGEMGSDMIKNEYENFDI